MEKYEQYMQMCISLAEQAQGQTAPNPLVGCVVVNDNSEIIATGYHAKYGANHAERDALLKIDDATGCTLVVNLEPCSHYGKTPPCTDLIIEKGIKRVVYGMVDPNPIVAGNGLKKLQEAGIEVIGPVLNDECRKLNEIFIVNQIEKRVYVAIKTATTIDGKIATANGNSKWITSEKARDRGRQLRQKYDAILTSSATVLADNPSMLHKRKVILDRNLVTDYNSNIYKQGEIIVFHEAPLSKGMNTDITFIKAPVSNGKLDINYVLKTLYDKGITSVFVEAGGGINGSFLEFADIIYHFVAPKIASDVNSKTCFYGREITQISECEHFKVESVEVLEPDILITYKKLLDNDFWLL